MANNKKKEGGETPLTDEEKAALAAQGEGGEGKEGEGDGTPLTNEENAALAAQAAQGEGGEGKEGEGNEDEGNEIEGLEAIVDVPRILEILYRFKVDECFETSDGSIFLSKNLAMLHTAQDAKKVKTHERKDFE